MNELHYGPIADDGVIGSSPRSAASSDQKGKFCAYNTTLKADTRECSSSKFVTRYTPIFNICWEVAVSPLRNKCSAMPRQHVLVRGAPTAAGRASALPSAWSGAEARGFQGHQDTRWRGWRSRWGPAGAAVSVRVGRCSARMREPAGSASERRTHGHCQHTPTAAGVVAPFPVQRSSPACPQSALGSVLEKFKRRRIVPSRV